MVSRRLDSLSALLALILVGLSSPSTAADEWRVLDMSRGRSWILPINEPTPHGSPVPELTPSQPPVKPITKPLEIHVWNSFEQGHFDANRIRFLWDKGTNRFVRRDTQAVGTFSGGNFSNDEDCFHLLMRGSTANRIEHTAFSDMAAAGYMPTSPPYEHYLSAELALHYNQQVFLEAVSWMTAKEVLEAFGGIIPWERVAEVFGPHHGTRAELRALVEQGTQGFHVLVRRAVLKLVASQFIVNDQVFTGALPWMSLPDLATSAFCERARSFFQFEVSRGAQLQGGIREVERLIALAGAIAEQMVRNISPFHGAEDASVYTVSLEKDLRPRLFELRLGAQVVAQSTEQTLMATRLTTLLEKRRPSEILDVHSRLVQALGLTESQAIELVEYFRTLQTKELDFIWQGVDYTPTGGGIVIRNYTDLQKEAVVSQLGVFNLSSEQREKAYAILSELPPLVRPENWRDARAVVDGFDWGALQLHPILMTNLNTTMAIHDSTYVHKLLLSWAAFGKSEDRDFDIAISTRPQDAEIHRQLKEAGLQERRAGQLFTWKMSLLHAYAHAHSLQLQHLRDASQPPLHFGRWARRVAQYDFPGL